MSTATIEQFQSNPASLLAAVEHGEPILISRGDVLTLQTAEAIGDPNKAIVCACPEKRPPAFNAAICKT